jgi:pimeloyl-ACP methyl ester carboxylesterase
MHIHQVHPRLAGIVAAAAGLTVVATLGAQLGPDEHRGTAADAALLRYVTVNGVRLAYRIEGAGVPVIFVHGEGYSHELWTKQIEPFAQKYQVIAYDRRGHGQSEAPFTGYSPIANAEDLNGLISFLGIRDAHFVVNSRGGEVISQFLRLYPQKVRSIVFADAALAVTELTPVFRAIIDRRNNDPLPTLEQAVNARQGAKTSSFTTVAQSRPEIREILNRMVDQYSPRVAMNPQRSDNTSAMDIGPWNVRDFPDMKTLSQPMLLVVGELTDPMFINAAREAHRLWPNARYEMIRGADHLLVLEAPDVFNKLALDFLTRHST